MSLHSSIFDIIDQSVISYLTKISNKHKIPFIDLLEEWQQHIQSPPTTNTSSESKSSSETKTTTSSTPPATPIEIPDEFACPILGTLMIDPVVTSDGHTYERNAILHWLKEKDTSPKTMKKLINKNVIPNHVLRAQIGDFRTANNLPEEDLWKPEPTSTETSATPTTNQNGQNGRSINIQINRQQQQRGPWTEAQVGQARGLLAHILQTTPHLVMDSGLHQHRQRGATWMQCADQILHNNQLFQLFKTEFKRHQLGEQLLQIIEARERSQHQERQRQQRSRETPPIQALRNDDANALNAMIVRGQCIPTQASADGQNILHMAAKMGRSSCVQMLLSRFFTQPTSNTRGSSREYKSLTEEEKLISINRPDSNGSTPLHLASFFGNQDVIEILLAANADVHAKMNQGDTPLIQASWNGHVNVVQLLLDKGAKINDTKEDGCTPLHLAVVRHQHKVVKRLLTYQQRSHDNADPSKTWSNCVNISGDTPLHLSCQAGCTHAAEMLLLNDGGDVGGAGVRNDATVMILSRNQRGMAPIHLAAYHGHKDLIKLFIECIYNGTHPGSIDSNGNLVDVDVNALGPDYPTTSHDVALHIACERGFVECVQLLLDSGSDVNLINPISKMYSLFYACKTFSQQHCDIIKLLGQYNVQEMVDNNGLTPLCAACSHGGSHGGVDPNREKIVRALIDIGQKINPLNTRDGMTPLLKACSGGGVNTNGGNGGGSGDGMLSVVRLLLSNGANVNACLKTSRSTALHLAAGKGLSEICLLLLEKGGDKKLVDLGGRRAAEVARRNNCVRVAVMIEGYDGGG